MDPFEEFEFKPLTEGLGFHKKAAEKPAAETPQPSRESNQSISDLIAALPPAIDFLDNEPATTSPAAPAAQPETRPQIFQPLGRKEYVPPEAVALNTKPAGGASLPPIENRTKQFSNRVSPGPSPVATSGAAPMPTLKSPLSAPATNDVTRAFPHLEKNRTTQTAKAPQAAMQAPMQMQLRKVSASFSAAILDGMITAGFATIFLVIILVITNIDLVAMLSHARTDMQTYMHLGLLFLAVLNIYMLSARGLFGATLGEWAFDLQIGTRQDQRKPMYLVKVIWRMILVMATGFITLPLLSKIARRDLFAALGGPQLYSRQLR